MRLVALANATLEPNGKKVCLIIEDALAKCWLQGQLKIHKQIYDYSFNSEIIRLSGDGHFSVLASIFDAKQTELFKAAYDTTQKEADHAARLKLVKEYAGSCRVFGA